MGIDREGEASISKRPLQVTDIVGREEFVVEMMGKRENVNRIYSTRERKIAIVGFKDDLVSDGNRDEGAVLVD